MQDYLKSVLKCGPGREHRLLGDSKCLIENVIEWEIKKKIKDDRKGKMKDNGY